MKKLVVIVSICFMLPIAVKAQKSGYDSTYAKKLMADDYGMKMYVFVTLKTGSNTSTDKVAKDKAFDGHMKNIKRLADNGKLVVAGPFENGGTFRGLFILNVATIEEAKALLEMDTAVKEKYLEPELLQWYGSAALQEVPKIHEKIQKTSF